MPLIGTRLPRKKPATWRSLIEEVLREKGLTFAEIESCTLSDAELDAEFDAEFDDGFGGDRVQPFTAWTKNWVLFPVVYDGAAWCGIVPRNPNGEAADHIGGG